ncbi:MAG: carbohydrate ABC transporter permease [Anaerolineae bacterium]|nr:carbohydrate ABC transporter permease [Anaerolineae bacterium]
MTISLRQRLSAYVILGILALLIVIPLIAGALTAFKPQIIWVSSPPIWIFQPTLENFEFVFIQRQNLLHLRNSLIIATGSVTIALILGVPAAYALARFRFRGSKGLLQWLISLRMIPPIVVALPFYVLFQTFDLRGTHFGLILAYLTFLIPLVIWMMRGYFVEIPSAMEESAMVEGYSRLQALRKVVLPVVTPGIIATALLNFIFAWNEYFLALILGGRDTSTLPVAAATYVGRARVEWGNLFAVNLIIMLPVIILTIILRRQLVKGLALGLVE